MILSRPKRLNLVFIKGGPERSTIEIEFLLIGRFINRLVLNIVVLLEWLVVVSLLELFLSLVSYVVVLSRIILLLIRGLSSKNCGILLWQLGEDFLAMLNLDQRGLQWLDGVEDLFLKQFVLNHIQGSLDHVVSELVVDELLDNKVDTSLQTLLLLVIARELGDDLLIVLWESTFEDFVDVSLLLIVTLGIEALFNYIAWKFHFTQSNKILGDLHENLLILAGVLKFENVLDQVVSVLVFDEIVHILDDEVCQFKLLGSGSLLQASLHDTAAMLVHSDVDTVLDAGIENELCVLRGQLASRQVLLLRWVRSLEDH